MDFFGVVSLLGGLAFFLYGMSMLGSGLEKLSGGRLETTLEKMTGNVFSSVLLGAAVTAAVQSSSATTVIVVGLVNARVLKLRQAIGIIMGANIGTTATAHILRLSGIESSNFWLRLLKPSTLAPMVAIIGIILFMAPKKNRRRDIGVIMIGFGLLFSGMLTMEATVKPLKDLPQFSELFSSFSNPILGVIVGAVVTAIIQSSSASVGILQALSSTGNITCSSAFPIILGQNIGTCITSILASIGTSKNAKRAASVHLMFNVIGTVIFLTVLYLYQTLVGFPFWNDAIDTNGIAYFHTVFNLTVTVLLIPFTGLLEKLAYKLVKSRGEDGEREEDFALDERIMRSPGLALSHSRKAVLCMGILAKANYNLCCEQLIKLNPKDLDVIKDNENTIDLLEDRLSSYLLKLSQKSLSSKESRELSELLHVMSEFERIGDYAINILECAQDLDERGAVFSSGALKEMNITTDAVRDIIGIAVNAFENSSAEISKGIEPLEEVVDLLQQTLKDRHINRLREGKCSVDAAFPFVETLANLERIADHCSNIGIYILSHGNEFESLNRHEYVRKMHDGKAESYNKSYDFYKEKYYNPVLAD